MNLKLITDGTSEGTQLVDAATGKKVEIEGAAITCSLAINQPPPKPKIVTDPKTGQSHVVPATEKHQPNTASVRIVLMDAPLEVAESCKLPFEWQHHNLR